MLVPIIMGSKTDLPFAQRIARALAELGVPCELRVASAHKSAGYLLEMLAAYEAGGQVTAYITVAGRSNALSGLVDAQVTAPVIACPPYAEAFGGADIYSSLRMPKGVAPLVVLEPEGAALAAAKIAALGDRAIAARIEAYHAQLATDIAADDAAVSLSSSSSSDKPREACGVFGIFAPGEDVARTTFFGLYALQHRGQESAGIAVSDGQRATLYKAMGLVSQVFTEEALKPLRGHIAIGHNRYSTKGSSRLPNAQPYLLESALGPLGVAHNGNLINAAALRRKLLQRGVGLISTSDSEIITQLLAGAEGATWEERIQGLMREARGAYSLAILTRRTLYAVRDPWGFRPLCLGRLNGGWVVASESCALATVGGEFVREVEPGEIVAIDEGGLRSIAGAERTRNALCIFEYIYFARPDSILQGQSIYRARCGLGAALAREAPVEADMVMGIPDSATTAAIGYAGASGIPYGEGLIKNRYIGRTFIQPDDRLRRAGVALKFNPLPDNLAGKRVVVVDDSIVRGNTSGPIVDMLRRAGAREIHMRVSSPPIRCPCMMGVDMATREELLAHRLDIEEIRSHLGVDSLAYLSLEGLLEGVGRPGDSFCLACFTGRYPVSETEEEGKEAFE